MEYNYGGYEYWIECCTCNHLRHSHRGEGGWHQCVRFNCNCNKFSSFELMIESLIDDNEKA